MRIVNEKSPVHDRAAEVFPLSGREIFAYGDTIYNPSGCDVPPWLVAHEEVHSRQQEEYGSVEEWWDRYLIDAQFRLDMETEAHQKEYRVYCYHNKDRNDRVRYLTIVARKLAAPLYAYELALPDAKRRIKNG